MLYHSSKKNIAMFGCILIASFILGQLLFGVHGSIRAGGSYLYEGSENSYPVIEYLKDSNEYSASDGLPLFLKSNYSTYRVVEFYSPWCGHCQHFKPHYITFAKEFTSRLLPNQNVEIFAVSCDAHRNLCRDQNIHSFPTLKTFKAGEIVKDGDKLLPGNLLKRDRNGLSVQMVALQLNISLTDTNQSLEPAAKSDSSRRVIASIQLSTNALKNKRDTFSDAGSSFLYALSSGVYMDNSALRSNRFLAFQGEHSFSKRVPL